MVSRFRSQDGASAVIVAMGLLLLFGAGAIAIDLGAMWETKRDLVVDTDAGALSAARLAATEGCSPSDPIEEAAIDFMSANLGTTLTGADIDFACVTPGGVAQANTVSVSLTQQATQALSGALGVEKLDVYSSSTATFNGYLAGPMRPLAMCNMDPAIAAYVPPGASGTLPADVIVSMGKTWTNTACGGGAGSWGYLCFDNANCSEGEIQTYMRDGHPHGVDLGDAASDGSPHPHSPPPGGTDEDCKLLAGGGTDWCEIRSGQAFTDNTPEAAILDSLVGESFSVLISDCIGKVSTSTACEAGSSSETFVHPYAIAYVTLHAWCSAKNNVGQSDWHPSDAGYTNAQCHGASSGNNDLVLAMTLHGVISEGAPEDFFNFVDPVVNLCGVDHDTVENRCVRP